MHELGAVSFGLTSTPRERGGAGEEGNALRDRLDPPLTLGAGGAGAATGVASPEAVDALRECAIPTGGGGARPGGPAAGGGGGARAGEGEGAAGGGGGRGGGADGAAGPARLGGGGGARGGGGALGVGAGLE